MIDLMEKAGFKRSTQFGQMRRQIEKLPGMEPISAHTWQLAVGKSRAQVDIAPGGALRISQIVPKPPAGKTAMELNHELPGNLRFASHGCQSVLIADTQVDGVTHLSRTIHAVKTGILFALGEPSKPVINQAPAPKAVLKALESGEWLDGFVVKHDAGWELRPRQHDDVTPVQAALGGESLRIFRPVIRDLDGISCPARINAICAEALRFNNQLRHSRLALSGGAILAEAHLHSEQLSRSWLDSAARAVAVASRHAEPVLGILAESREAAELYSNVFLK